MVGEKVEVFWESRKCERCVFWWTQGSRESNAPSVRGVKGVDREAIVREKHGEVRGYGVEEAETSRVEW
jgi:hypothetical protein